VPPSVATDQTQQTPSSSPAQTPDAQTQGSDKDNKDTAKPDSGKPDAAKPDSAKPEKSKDRLFFALPNFNTVEPGGKVLPMTAGQKFKLVARGAFDPAQIPWYAAIAGINQAENSEPGFGQGAAGYGKRFGATAADGVIENFFVGAIFPSMLHQDPRFFPTTTGGFFRRASYAASRIVITRSDSGKKQFNFSEVLGSAAASAISTYSYHPHPGYHPEAGMNVPYIASDRTLTNTAKVWGSQMGYDAITLVIKEFWPDLRRKVKKQPAAANLSTTQP